jgi:hypothetical protein
MARRDVPVKKYAVRQSEDERRRLKELVRNGKSQAKRLLKARILLKSRRFRTRLHRNGANSLGMIGAYRSPKFHTAMNFSG